MNLEPTTTLAPTADLLSRLAFVRTELPALGPLVAKVARVHGEHNPKLLDLQRIFLELRETVEEHRAGERLDVAEPLRLIRSLADDFTAPDWACSSYRTLVARLWTLEEALLALLQGGNQACPTGG